MPVDACRFWVYQWWLHLLLWFAVSSLWIQARAIFSVWPYLPICFFSPYWCPLFLWLPSPSSLWTTLRGFSCCGSPDRNLFAFLLWCAPNFQVKPCDFPSQPLSLSLSSWQPFTSISIAIVIHHTPLIVWISYRRGLSTLLWLSAELGWFIFQINFGEGWATRWEHWFMCLFIAVWEMICELVYPWRWFHFNNLWSVKHPSPFIWALSAV